MSEKNGAMRVGGPLTSRPTKLQELTIEVETLRALRNTCDVAMNQVIDQLKREHAAEVAELKREHAERLEELKHEIKRLRQDLAFHQTHNHAAELEKAKHSIDELIAEDHRKALILESIGATLQGVINMHLGGPLNGHGRVEFVTDRELLSRLGGNK